MIDGPCTDVTPTLKPVHVTLPDGSTISSTHMGLLPLPHLPATARRAHIFPALASGSLLSIRRLCDAGCTALFDTAKVEIRLGHSIVSNGHRSNNGLWHVPLPATAPPPSVANLSTLPTQTARDRTAFLHAAAGYPVVTTWLKAIAAGFYTTWPGLSTSSVRSHLLKSRITALGHLD